MDNSRLALIEAQCHRDAVRRLVIAAQREIERVMQHMDEIADDAEQLYRELEERWRQS